MKTTVAFTAALTLGASLTIHAGTLAGPITNATNGHLYYLLTEDTWQSSEAQAVELGGHLAAINNQAEQDWVFSTFGSYAGTNRSLWIGLREVGSEGNYQWVSGEPVGYSNWASGEPNNAQGNESYVHMINIGNIFGHPGGIWNDLHSPNTSYPTFDPICGVVEVVPSTTVGTQTNAAIWTAAEIGWPSDNSKLYQVQWASSLSPTTWLDFGVPVQGNGTTNSVFDTTRNRPKRFYRVLELP